MYILWHRPRRTRENCGQLNYLSFFLKEKRRLAINNARRQWEVMQGSLMTRSHRLVHGAMPDLVASHVANIRNSELAGEEAEDSEASRPRFVQHGFMFLRLATSLLLCIGYSTCPTLSVSQPCGILSRLSATAPCWRSPVCRLSMLARIRWLHIGGHCYTKTDSLAGN